MKNTIESIDSSENNDRLKIVIKRNSEAPEKWKKNPFYDEEFFGRANSPDDIFLPDSDMAISFAIAAHEIGHLSQEGAAPDESITLDNFEESAMEEQRAWIIGKRYLQSCIDEYFGADSETKAIIEKTINNIEAGMTDIVEWSQPLYLENGVLDGLDAAARDLKITEAREKFASTNFEKYRQIVDEKIKAHKIGRKVDWEKFTGLVKKCVEKIIEDNEKLKKSAQ